MICTIISRLKLFHLFQRVVKHFDFISFQTFFVVQNLEIPRIMMQIFSLTCLLSRIEINSKEIQVNVWIVFLLPCHEITHWTHENDLQINHNLCFNWWRYKTLFFKLNMGNSITYYAKMSTKFWKWYLDHFTLPFQKAHKHSKQKSQTNNSGNK